MWYKGYIYLYHEERYGMPQLGINFVNVENPADSTFVWNNDIQDAMDELGIYRISGIAGYAGQIPAILAN